MDDELFMMSGILGKSPGKNSPLLNLNLPIQFPISQTRTYRKSIE
jgi:hypothetical protein